MPRKSRIDVRPHCPSASAEALRCRVGGGQAPGGIERRKIFQGDRERDNFFGLRVGVKRPWTIMDWWPAPPGLGFGR